MTVHQNERSYLGSFRSERIRMLPGQSPVTRVRPNDRTDKKGNRDSRERERERKREREREEDGRIATRFSRGRRAGR